MRVAVEKVATRKDSVGWIAHVNNVQNTLIAVVVAQAHHVGATLFFVCKYIVPVAKTAVVIVRRLGDQGKVVRLQQAQIKHLQFMVLGL